MDTTIRCKNCISFKSGTPPLTDNREDELLKQTPTWSIGRTNGTHRLIKNFDLNSFIEAIGFFKTIAIVAEEENHHPFMSIDYRTVSIELSTKSVRGLSENDFIMAAKIDNIYSMVTEPMIGILESAML
jgi:4a-hydroxytetrahydrobiopterin dehydratase